MWVGTRDERPDGGHAALYCIDARHGAAQVLHQFAPKPTRWQPGDGDDGSYGGRPDGAAVDIEGNYWCALYEGSRVVQLSPSGEPVGQLKWIGGVWKFKAMGYEGADLVPSGGALTAQHNRTFATLDAAAIEAGLLGSTG